MSPKEKYSAVALAVLAIGSLYLKWRGHPNMAGMTLDDPNAAEAASSGASSNPQDAFASPYLNYSNPGISDAPIILNGGAPFESTVNVTVNPSYLGTLSQQYIPMFGYVGIGVVPANDDGGAGAPVQLTAPPPPPAQFPAGQGAPLTGGPFESGAYEATTSYGSSAAYSQFSQGSPFGGAAGG